METTVEFKVWGRMALFSDPITRIGGEKCSYSVPTYEALRGVLESIYWKPTITWVVDKVRVMNKIKTQPRSAKLHKLNGSTDLSIYTYLSNVCYQVQAHFEFNPRRRGEFLEDWSCIKHLKIMRRAIEKGGRRDIFLGTRECQVYVEPVIFGAGDGYYDNVPEIPLGTMLHGINYPNQTGVPKMQVRFWQATMDKGIIKFPRPDECRLVRDVRKVELE